MLKILIFFILIFFIKGCGVSNFVNLKGNAINSNNQDLIIQKKLHNKKIDKYYLAQKEKILEKLKLANKLEKDKKYKEANALKERVISDLDILAMKADIEDMKEKEQIYKKDLEVYGNNTVLDELDELLKNENSRSDINQSIK